MDLVVVNYVNYALDDSTVCTSYYTGGPDYCVPTDFEPVPDRLFRNRGDGTFEDVSESSGLHRSFGRGLGVVCADFNGDGRKDLVQLSSKRLRVSRWTPAGYRKIYEAKISGGVALAVGDASGDGRADIYVVRDTNKKNLPDRLLIGRKGGRKFTSVKIPQTSKGNGDDVMALDYDKNGLMDFFVLNGRKQAGPVQLLASFRR